ncbi:MAG TPA: hypothetical protein VFC42_13260 [Methylomirabilota bacterium]|jgi:coenzyme PQQ precursor peptide PqqA|nr:hypothetical protein [Methylomirabilota bacterium]
MNLRPRPDVPGREVTAMTWETPTFVELRMDAELTAYQDDLGDL